MDEFKLMNAFLGFSDLDKNPEIKLKNKERIVFATMKNMIPDWQRPHNWDNLSTETKLERLQKLQDMVSTF